MACLSLSTGPFSNVAFSTSLSGTAAGKAVVLAAGGLSVGGSLVLPAVSGFQLSAAILGGQFLVALSVEQLGSGFPSQRRVFVVNPATSAVVTVLTVSATSNAISLPVVQSSPGSPSLLAVWAPDGPAPLGQIVGSAIVRSDNGAVVLGGIGSFTPTGVTLGGEVTATQLVFRFHSGGSAQQAAVSRPAGQATVTSANPQNFGTVPIGGCPVTPPTRTYVVRNTGNDCLPITGIAPSGPYTVTTTTPPLPATLDPAQTLTVDVTFAPAATGTFNGVHLALAPIPPNGPVSLEANGKAVAAVASASFSATTFNFGKVPNGVTPAAKTLNITNNGTAPLTVTVPAGAANGFSWDVAPASPPLPSPVVLACGASVAVKLQFTAGLPEGMKQATFLVSHSAPSGSQAIQLNASVCVANPEITAPPSAPIGFGQIQQGFRTVKLLKSVQNPGDGPLTFTAEIISTSGPNPALAFFGIPDPAGGQISGPPSRTFTLNPVNPCGGTAGTGSVDVPISFRADPAPGVITGLALRIASATPPFTRDYPLSAEVIPPIPLDVALVIDRSGSMNGNLGTRRKIDAAVSAGQLFVELLRPNLDDRVALVRFSTTPDLLQPITPVSTLASPTQDQLRTRIATDIPPADGWTGISGGAILGILEVLKPRAVAPAALTRAVVVLTDGIENRAHQDPPGSGPWFTLLGGPSQKPDDSAVSTTPLIAPGNVTLFAVGLGRPGEVSDPQLAALMQPAGSPFRVDQDLTGTKYFELEKRFTQIYMDVAGVASVLDPMYWIGPGDTHTIEFEVLPGDLGAMVVLYDWEGLRLPFHCVSPRGEILDPASVAPGFQYRSAFTSTARIVEFKVPKGEPKRYAGTWKVVVHHPGVVCHGGLETTSHDQGVGFVSRRACKGEKNPLLYGIAIGVGSDFRMQPFVTPGPVHVGEPILLTAVVSEAGLPVTGATVTVRIETPTGATSQVVLKDDGSHLDGDPGDGEYARTFTSTTVDGVYHFTFRTEGRSRDGKPVVREALRDKEVLRKGRIPGNPLGGGDSHGGPDGPPPGDGEDDCCRKLLRAIEHQTSVLRRVVDSKSV